MKLSKMTPNSIPWRYLLPIGARLENYCIRCGAKVEHCVCRENLEQKIIEAQDELEELKEEYRKLTGYHYRGEI